MNFSAWAVRRASRWIATVLIIIPTLATVPIAAFSTTSCDELRLLSKSEPKTFRLLRKSGTYCLTEDIYQGFRRSKYDYRTGLIGREYFIGILASDVVVDLSGYTLKAEMPGWSGFFDPSHNQSASTVLSRVRIVNGTIDVRSDGIGAILPRWQPVASVWADFSAEPELRQPREPAGKPSEVPNEIRTHLQYTKNYVGSSYHFENLTILAGSYALKLAGRGNTIRGNRIEVTNSKSAIYLFGPDNLIENNIIVFRGDAITMTAAPIKLHLGDRTIIRNNIFIVEADEKAPAHVVSLIESAGVQFSGNRIYGVSRLSRAFDLTSTFESSENVTHRLDRKPVLSRKVRKASDVL